MALLFSDHKTGSLYVSGSPYTVPASIIVENLPDAESGCVVTGFDLQGKIRHSIDYAISGNEYFYVYGPEVFKININGLTTFGSNCADVYGNHQLLSFVQSYNVAVPGNPVVDIAITPVTLIRALLTGVNLGEFRQIPNISSFSLNFIGKFYSI